jgi:hypothetical protein
LERSEAEPEKEEVRPWEIQFTGKAFKDVQEAVDYYDSISPGLGDNYLKDIEIAVKSLGINPYFQIRYRYVRCLRLKHFPYLIHFKLLKNKRLVKVIAILHTSRKWPG